MRKFLLFLVLSILSFSIRAEYYNEYQIPMRDGNWLAADFWTADSFSEKPVILIQTPYNKNNYRIRDAFIDPTDTNTVFDFMHYHFVIVDWRGFYGSTGAAETGYSRGLDGYDCVEWIAGKSWCNGRIGTYGGSALGMQQFNTIWEHPPHLVCAAPWIKDYRSIYHSYFPGGVLIKEHIEALIYLGFSGAAITATHYLCCDWYWNYVEDISNIPEEIDVPVFMVTGWFDHYPSEIIRSFHDLRDRSVDSVRYKHKLMVGPWTHSGVDKELQGELNYGAAENSASIMANQFFDKYLRDADNGYEDLPVGQYFIMQSDEWLEADDWYSVETIIDTFYLISDGILSESYSSSGEEFSSFNYDPSDPSPAIGSNRFNPSISGLKIGPYDIRDSVEARDDNLIFTTAPLDEDLTIYGSIKLLLYVSSNQTDTDIAVRLTDVYPDGRSMILTTDIQRMRLLESYATENLITPGEIYPVEINLQELAQTFKAGHSMRIVLTGSIYPMYDRNLNNGGPMYEEGDTLISLTSIHHNGDYRSMIILPKYNSSATVCEEIPPMPSDFNLKAYPNPFNSSISIEILDGYCFDGIYDIRGNLIYNPKEQKPAKTIEWQPDDAIESGVYLLRVRNKACFFDIRKLIYIK